MNKETLEKMAWLYEQGFKSDHYIDHSDSFVTTVTPDDIEHVNKVIAECDFCYPYFTESRLWSLLKEVSPNWKISTSRNKVLLEILLDKVIYEIKEGHLKAEEKQ
jgi:hypothetical protein